jgi:hypothetical protein
LWEPRSKTAIITDAGLGAGLLDMDRTVISPPPYFEVAAYEATVALPRSLSPRLLLTTHYAVMKEEEAARFLEESATFVERAQRAASEALTENGELGLRRLLEATNPTLEPFTGMENELAGTLRVHARELVAVGRAEEVSESPTIRRATG